MYKEGEGHYEVLRMHTEQMEEIASAAKRDMTERPEPRDLKDPVVLGIVGVYQVAMQGAILGRGLMALICQKEQQ